MALPASPWLARLRTAIVAAPASLIAIRFPARFLRRPVRLVLLLAAILLIATALSTLALGSPAFFGGPGWSLTMITGAWHGGKSMLRLVDPLIGTANGGWYSVRVWATDVSWVPPGLTMALNTNRPRLSRRHAAVW